MLKKNTCSFVYDDDNDYDEFEISGFNNRAFVC
jgi:hypothetical protein